MKRNTEALSGQKKCFLPVSVVRRFLVFFMAFAFSVAPAIAQESVDEKGVFDQVIDKFLMSV